jgi:hypothetical protein
MPRPSKRVIATRTSGAVGAQKRRRIIPRSEEIPDSCSDGSALSSSSNSEAEDGVIEDDPEDDVLVLAQPEGGWKEAERRLPGYSKTNTGKTKQSRWHHAQQKKKQEMEKVELQKTYGNISRFSRAVFPSRSPAPSSTLHLTNPFTIDASTPSDMAGPPSRAACQLRHSILSNYFLVRRYPTAR